MCYGWLWFDMLWCDVLRSGYQGVLCYPVVFVVLSRAVPYLVLYSKKTNTNTQTLVSGPLVQSSSPLYRCRFSVGSTVAPLLISGCVPVDRGEFGRTKASHKRMSDEAGPVPLATHTSLGQWRWPPPGNNRQWPTMDALMQLYCTRPGVAANLLVLFVVVYPK